MKLATLLTTSLLASTAVLAVTPASADEIDRRQYWQQQRIEQGVRTGEINRWEYRRLQEEQSRIAAMERRAKADGFIDPYERAQIRHAQNNASRHIYEEKHDGQTRYNRWWRWW